MWAESKLELEQGLRSWLGEHLRGYRGMVNIESIGGTIIECHLRFADQWPDLYGSGFVESVVELYAHGRWAFADTDRRTAYSVVLFGGHGPHYRRVDRAVVEELLQDPEISSVQITFHEDKPPEQHAMPPGGFRLAVINCWKLDSRRVRRSPSPSGRRSGSAAEEGSRGLRTPLARRPELVDVETEHDDVRSAPLRSQRTTWPRRSSSIGRSASRFATGDRSRPSRRSRSVRTI